MLVLCLLSLWVAVSASAQTRVISRTNDVRLVRPEDQLVWFQGETVEYNLFTRRGGAAVAFSNDAAPIWSVTDDTLTNFFVRSTGTLVNATNGHARWILSASQSALTSKLYQSFAFVTGSGGALLGDRAAVLVRPNAEWGGSFVGPNTNILTQLDGNTVALDVFWIRYSSNIATIVGGQYATTQQLAAAVAGLGATNVTAANLLANGGAGITTGTLYLGASGDAASNLAALAYLEATNAAALAAIATESSTGFVRKKGDVLTGGLTATVMRATSRFSTPLAYAGSLTVSNEVFAQAFLFNPDVGTNAEVTGNGGLGAAINIMRVGTNWFWFGMQPTNFEGVRFGFPNWYLSDSGSFADPLFTNFVMTIKADGVYGAFNGTFVGGHSGAFSGTFGGDGSALSAVNADTLDGLNSTDFARSNAVLVASNGVPIGSFSTINFANPSSVTTGGGTATITHATGGSGGAGDVISASNNTFSGGTTQTMYDARFNTVTVTNAVVVNRYHTNSAIFYVQTQGSNKFVMSSSMQLGNSAFGSRSFIGTSGNGRALVSTAGADLSLDWLPNGTNSIEFVLLAVTNIGVSILPRVMSITVDNSTLANRIWVINPEGYMARMYAYSTNNNEFLTMWNFTGACFQVGSGVLAQSPTNAAMITSTNAQHLVVAHKVYGEQLVMGLQRLPNSRVTGVLTSGVCIVQLPASTSDTNYVPLLSYNATSYPAALAFDSLTTNSFRVLGATNAAARFDGFVIGY